MKTPDTLKFTGKDSSIVGEGKNKILEAIYEKLKIKNHFKEFGKQDFSGNLPGFFVGSYGYPRVSAGFLSTEHYENNDEPLLWSKHEDRYDLLRIIKLRSMLVNSRFSVHVKNVNRDKSNIMEVSMASNPVDAEVHLEKKPYYSLSINRDNLPRGPSVPLKKIDITTNPKIPGFAEKIESDTDLKAVKGINALYKEGFDEHYITRVFSAGNLGFKVERKIVPTKWSITAVDDTIGKEMTKRVKDFREHDYSAMFGGYMGNYYLVLTFPGPWSYELFETYVGDGLSDPMKYESAVDFEGPFGRKSYASNTAGGYYAARLACLEYFNKVKRRGSVLLLRFITSEYWVPLGVWVVREASRKAFCSKPLIFGSEELVLKYARSFSLKRFGIDPNKIFLESKLLRQLKEQNTLSKYF